MGSQVLTLMQLKVWRMSGENETTKEERILLCEKPAKEGKWSYLSSKWSSSKALCSKSFASCGHPRISKLGRWDKLLQSWFRNAAATMTVSLWEACWSTQPGKRIQHLKCHSDGTSQCGGPPCWPPGGLCAVLRGYQQDGHSRGSICSGTGGRSEENRLISK